MAPIYIPSPGLHTALDDFRAEVSSSHSLQLNSYDDLHAFSISRINDFWMSLWRCARFKASVQPSKAVDETIPIDHFPSFFEEARLNYAENLLCGDDDSTAVISIGEDSLGNPQICTWRALRDLVARYASALRSEGIKKGDLVSLIGSNCARSLALLLATASIGAIFASFSTDIGEKALTDRFMVLQPRLIFMESSYTYGGKHFSIVRKVAMCVEDSGLRSKRLVIIGAATNLCHQRVEFEEFLKASKLRPLEFVQVPFNTPVVIMFSSGTTGAPKGIVHSHGGLLLNGFKENRLHNNFGPNDTYFHFTNIGWTLWNISLGALLCKSTLVLYDGSPFYPSPLKLLRAVFDLRVTSFGAGPRYFWELQQRNIKPKALTQHLHTIFSTGAVLTPSLALWIAEAFGPVCQISFSGGTELCGSFVHGTRSLASYPGEIAVKALGMDVVAVSPVDGKCVEDGESGELVCRKPFPNMPVMFLHDPGKKRYHAAYFQGFPHVWTHGDMMRNDPNTKGIFILGRSDGTLNPSGVRFGSSDIYNVLALPQFHSSIADAVVVGQQRSTGPYSDTTERVLLFIQCHPAASSKKLMPTKRLELQIREKIAKDLSRRHVPAHIFEIRKVPYNVNGKKMEIQVKRIVNGGESHMPKGLDDQEAEELGQFHQFFHLETLVNGFQHNAAKL